MNANENNVPPPIVGDDTQALLQHLATGKPLDPETYRRIRGQAERVTEALRRQYGEMNIAVDLIRETRDEA